MLNVLLLLKKIHQIHKIHKNLVFLLKYAGFCSFIHLFSAWDKNGLYFLRGQILFLLNILRHIYLVKHQIRFLNSGFTVVSSEQKTAVHLNIYFAGVTLLKEVGLDKSDKSDWVYFLAFSLVLAQTVH